MDGRTFQPRQVIGVHGLRVLEQHVVGDVDDVVDRPDAARAEPPLHPVRAWANLDSFDHRADEAAAELGVVDRHLDQILARRVRAAREGRHEIVLHRAVEADGELARDAQVAHLVWPVREDLGLDDRLARDDGGQRLTWRAALEDHDSRVVVAEHQLVRRRHHAARGEPGDVHVFDELAAGHRSAREGDRNQAACAGVGRSRDDLLDVVAKVHLVDPERVARLGMRFLFEDLADDDLREVDHGERVDLDAEAGQDLGRVFRRDAFEVDEIAEPLVGDLHFLGPDTPQYRIVRTNRGFRVRDVRIVRTIRG